MKRLTDHQSRYIFSACLVQKSILPHPPKISKSLLRGGISCVRHLTCLTVYTNAAGSKRKAMLTWLKGCFGIKDSQAEEGRIRLRKIRSGASENGSESDDPRYPNNPFTLFVMG